MKYKKGDWVVLIRETGETKTSPFSPPNVGTRGIVVGFSDTLVLVDWRNYKKGHDGLGMVMYDNCSGKSCWYVTQDMIMIDKQQILKRILDKTA